MNFVKAQDKSLSSDGPSVSWTNNPIYQTPEHAGISWYDQATHWDPNSEGIQSISQSSTNNPIPYWANREEDLAGIRSQYDKSSKMATENAVTQVKPPIETPKTFGSLPTPVAPIQDVAKKGTESARSVSKAAAITQGVGSAAVGAASLTGPIGTAAMINAALGAGTSSIMNAENQARSGSDFVKNSLVQGSQATKQADLIRTLQQNQLGIEKAGSDVGGLFGPIGAVMGGAIGRGTQDKINPYDLKTGFGFNGMFNPQDTGAVNSLSTSSLSGQTNLISTI